MCSLLLKWFVSLSLLWSSFLHAGLEPPMPLAAPVPILSQEEGMVFLDLFRSQALQKSYEASCLLSSKKSKPLWDCHMRATPAPEGTCIVLRFQSLQEKGSSKDFLLLQGKDPMAVEWVQSIDLQGDFYNRSFAEKKFFLEEKANSGACRLIPFADWFKPFLAGLSITVFDFLMPFLFWEGVYYKSTTFKGRIVHQFDLQPPASSKGLLPEGAWVRISIDSGFKVLVEMSVLSQEKVVLQTFRANSIKKTGNRWFLGSAEQSLPLQKQKTLISLENHG